MNKDKVKIVKDPDGNIVSIDIAKAPILVHGKDGSNGRDGQPGQDGQDGCQGEKGLQGEVGAVGPIGATGATGANYDPSIEKQVITNKDNIASAEKNIKSNFFAVDKETSLIKLNVNTLNSNLEEHIDNDDVHFDDKEQKEEFKDLLKNGITQIAQSGNTPPHNYLQYLDGGSLGTNPKEYYHLTSEDYANIVSDAFLFRDGHLPMTGDLDMDNYPIENVGHIQFDVEHIEEAHQEGRLHWDDDAGTLELGMPGGNVNLQIGQETVIRATNEEDITILNGQVVRISGATGATPKVSLVSATDHFEACCTIALATEDVLSGKKGYFTAFGIVREVKTDEDSHGNVVTEGDALYLSTTAGGFVITPPESPDSRVVLGTVLRAHQTEGVIFARIHPSPNIEELSNVHTTDPENRQALMFIDEDPSSIEGRWENQQILSTDVNMATCGLDEEHVATVQDWVNKTQSSGVISGGVMTDNGDGTISVSAGTGIIREENERISSAHFTCFAANPSLLMVDDSTNYVYVDYNDNNPIVATSTLKSTINNHDHFLLGKVFQEGNTAHIVNAGMVINDNPLRTLSYLTSLHGEVVRTSGFVVSEVTERYLATTDGVLFAGLTRLTTTGIDTSGVDDFEYYYYNGTAWVENDASQIDNLQYNDITTGLVELTAQRYGVHWVYGDPEGHLLVLYGQGDYTLALAQVAQPPSALPPHVRDFGFLAAKIIIQKSDTDFNSIGSAYDTVFTPSGAVDHGDLSGLLVDDHTQYWVAGTTRADNYTTTGTVTADKGVFTDSLNALTLGDVAVDERVYIKFYGANGDNDYNSISFDVNAGDFFIGEDGRQGTVNIFGEVYMNGNPIFGVDELSIEDELTVGDGGFEATADEVIVGAEDGLFVSKITALDDYFDFDIDDDSDGLYYKFRFDGEDNFDFVSDKLGSGNPAWEFYVPVLMSGIKSGATQAGAGAAQNELWKTASHATLPDNVVMIGA